MKSFKNKKCLITGASSGLGLEVTKLLIREGAEVIMLCRDYNKSNEIISNLSKAYPGAKIHLELADFSSLKSILTFIDRFKARYSSLDILINNAAVLKAKFSKSKDGFESMFQVNYLAPFILTNNLIELLRSGKDPQILNIALPPKKLQLDFNDLQSINRFKPMDHLMKTKLCLFMYSMELAERLKDSNIKVITGVPNNKPFKSALGREMPYLMGLVMNLISVKIEKIVDNILFVLTQENQKNGFVFKGHDAVSLTPYWKNRGVRDRLWSETEHMVKMNIQNKEKVKSYSVLS